MDKKKRVLCAKLKKFFEPTWGKLLAFFLIYVFVVFIEVAFNKAIPFEGYYFITPFWSLAIILTNYQIADYNFASAAASILPTFLDLLYRYLQAAIIVFIINKLLTRTRS